MSTINLNVFIVTVAISSLGLLDLGTQHTKAVDLLREYLMSLFPLQTYLLAIIRGILVTRQITLELRLNQRYL